MWSMEPRRLMKAELAAETSSKGKRSRGGHVCLHMIEELGPSRVKGSNSWRQLTFIDFNVKLMLFRLVSVNDDQSTLMHTWPVGLVTSHM